MEPFLFLLHYFKIQISTNVFMPFLEKYNVYNKKNDPYNSF